MNHVRRCLVLVCDVSDIRSLPGLRLWFLLPVLLFTGETAARDPNVVFILVDDWGVTDAAVLGSDFFETPAIDRLAADGLRFTQAYAASPVCSPTRAAILTGRSPARLDMTIWHEGARDGGPKDRPLLNAVSRPNLPREEVTLAELFRAKGYATIHIGKWHLGRAAWYPETQGYDLNVGGTCWGAPVSYFYPYRGAWSASDPELRYVPIGPGKEGDYLTDRLTDHAIEAVRRHRGEPFFLSLWFHTVHTPIMGKPKLVRRFQNRSPGAVHRHAEYAAMIACLDDNIGRLLSVLEELDLADDTIVVLTSDNGGVDFPSRRSGNRPPTSNAPYRSGKGTLYEGGIRVPLIIRWPGRTQPNGICRIPVTSQDFLPTFAAGCGLADDLPAESDGISLMPLLDNPEADLGRDTLYWHYPHYYPRMTPGSAVRQGNWKLIHYYEGDRTELYDLASDEGETTDLARQHPDRVRRMRQLLDTWRTSVQAKAPRPNPDYRAGTP